LSSRVYPVRSLWLFAQRTKIAANATPDPAERNAEIDKKLSVREILADNGGAMPRSLEARPECRRTARQDGFWSKGDSTPAQKKGRVSHKYHF
jgi:hypothetical protein